MRITNSRTKPNPIFNAGRSFVYTMNGRWHKRAMQIYMLVIISHLLEHLVQAYQLWFLHWQRPQCLGLLGLIYPWLMKSEWLHYGHALFMLVGLAVFRPSFVGRSRIWWDIAFGLQFYHHIEHALLLGQVIMHQNLFDASVPTSIGQLWFPRLELHLFYNLMVFFPMLIALYYHRFPPSPRERLV